MTLTKYQRGDTIEGWNDCPIYVPNRGSDSSVASRSNKTSRKRPPRRLGHNISAPLPGGSSTPTSISSTPPIPSRNLNSTVNFDEEFNIINTQHISKKQDDKDSDSAIDDTTITARLEELLQYPTTLQVNEIKHYQIKLGNVVDSLKQKDKLFLNGILIKGLKVPVDKENKADISVIKQEILTYMMANQGVSSWCAPLKKTIEGLKINT